MADTWTVACHGGRNHHASAHVPLGVAWGGGGGCYT